MKNDRLETHRDVQPKKVRKYNGPPKGSEEAKERMAKVRAAQWAKNGLVVSDTDTPGDGQRETGA